MFIKIFGYVRQLLILFLLISAVGGTYVEGVWAAAGGEFPNCSDPAQFERCTNLCSYYREVLAEGTYCSPACLNMKAYVCGETSSIGGEEVSQKEETPVNHKESPQTKKPDETKPPEDLSVSSIEGTLPPQTEEREKEPKSQDTGETEKVEDSGSSGIFNRLVDAVIRVFSVGITKIRKFFGLVR